MVAPPVEIDPAGIESKERQQEREAGLRAEPVVDDNKPARGNLFEKLFGKKK